MIWAALAIAIIGLLGGGNETFFLTPDLKKNVKTFVEDKERKAEIFALMKESKKRQVAFVKLRKKTFKDYKKLNLDRNTTLEKHQAFVNDYFDARKEISAFSIDKELAMKKLMTEEEWNNIMNSVMEKTDKDKIRKKMEQSSQKFFETLTEMAETSIVDATKKGAVMESLDEFQEDINTYIPSVAELSYKNLETIRDYNATKYEYENGAEELQKMRREINDDFLKLRFQLLELTTEKEWNKIIKAYNNLIKKP